MSACVQACMQVYIHIYLKLHHVLHGCLFSDLDHKKLFVSLTTTAEAMSARSDSPPMDLDSDDETSVSSQQCYSKPWVIMLSF